MYRNACHPIAIPLLLILAIGLAVGCAADQATVAPHVTGVTEEVGELLITPETLETRLADKRLRILDVRPAAEYAKAHIPGAVHLDISAWKNLALSDGGLQDANAWAKNVGSLAIDNDTSVVVYGGALNDVGRAWWLLKYVGLADVRLLDGDWDAWQAANRPFETGTVDVVATEFQPQLQTDRLAQTADVKRYIEDSSVVILDARSEREYMAGHVPTAVNLDWSVLLTDDDRFKTPEELRKIFENAALDDARTVVSSCATGSRSSAQVFALELAGYTNVKNYFGSLRQWSREAE